MDVSRRRAGVKTSVVAGSVWESRMKLDEVKGGIKVFNAETINNEDAATNNNNASESSSPSSRKFVKRSPTGTSVKRKTWKSESFDGPIQIAKGKTNSSSSIKNCEEQCRELSVSVDGGIKKSSMLSSRRGGGRSDGSNKELSKSVDGIDKSLILGKKARSDAGDHGNERTIRKSRSDIIKEVVESGAQLRKLKSDSVTGGNNQSIVSNKDINAVVFVDSGIEKSSIKELKKANSETQKVLDESDIKDKSSDDSDSGIEKNPPEFDENGFEESCKEFGVCQEKVISSNETNGPLPKSPPQFLVGNQIIDGDEELGDEEEEQEEEIDEEMEIDVEVEIEIEKKSVDIMEISIPEEKPKMKVEAKAPPSPQEQKRNDKKVEFSIPEHRSEKVIVNEENKKVYQFRNRAAPPTSSTLNKQPPPVIRRAAIYQNLSKPTSTPVVNECQNFPERHSKLQNIVDLVMWRDISRSAFVFGIGTFIIISSSYTNDLNISFISVMSYLGLVYLALIFLYRTLICRGVTDIDDTAYVVGEGEAIWLLKLVLPYLNECLLKIKALFSGDPATTMKMAVMLFVFARCGSSITIWKMAKLGFFGVFTVPKVCSSYSTQLTAYAKFWIRRFRDAWESCSHKKAVALAIFTLVWNLSSMAARVWAVFMMYVAVRYYQQSMEIDDEDWVEDDAGDDETLIGQEQGFANGTTSVEVNKVKKWA